MFGREYDYSLIQTTSKEALKRSALVVANYDIKKATEIYDYFAKDMPDLPTVEPEAPNPFNQIRDTTASLFQWGTENQDMIIGAINMVRSMMGKSPLGVPPVSVDVPPPVVN